MPIFDWLIAISWLFFNVRISLHCFRYKEVKPLYSIGAEFSARSYVENIKPTQWFFVPRPIVLHYSSYEDQYLNALRKFISLNHLIVRSGYFCATQLYKKWIGSPNRCPFPLTSPVKSGSVIADQWEHWPLRSFLFDLRAVYLFQHYRRFPDISSSLVTSLMAVQWPLTEDMVFHWRSCYLGDTFKPSNDCRFLVKLLIIEVL